ncbi:hypothetical protein [Paenibacillus sp. SI8]|uniref:hypothetical protein n=1 Tax=unclassified Paenibacillus TaxID=185978 RepID=UPI0034656D0E
MTDKIIVMEKDGFSYVKLSEYSSHVFGNTHVINGVDAIPAPGDNRYAIVEGTVNTIERKRKTSRRVIGYELYERYKEITQLPHEVPVDSFTYDDDGDLCGETAEFYRAKYDDPKPYLEPVEFEVIDRNCAPVQIPSYVTIEFPNNIAKFPETQHKYPCRISAETVFNLVYDRVKERVDGSDDKYYIDNLRNIQMLRVDERIAIPYHETRSRSYYPSVRSRKPKTVTEQVRWKMARVFELKGPKYGSGADNVLLAQTVRGNNYAELQTNLEAYIRTFLTQLDEGKRQVCAHCRGEGIVEVTK